MTMSFKNRSPGVNNVPCTTTKAGRKSKKTKRFVSSDSPILDKDLHKDKGIGTLNVRQNPTNSKKKKREGLHLQPKTNTTRVLIKDKSLRHDKDKGPTHRERHATLDESR